MLQKLQNRKHGLGTKVHKTARQLLGTVTNRNDRRRTEFPHNTHDRQVYADNLDLLPSLPRLCTRILGWSPCQHPFLCRFGVAFLDEFD